MAAHFASSTSDWVRPVDGLTDRRLLLEHRSLEWLFCVGWRASQSLYQSEPRACANARFYSKDGRPGNSPDIARPFLLIRSAIAGIGLIKSTIIRLSWLAIVV